MELSAYRREERSLSHLFPKESSDPECATTFATQSEQSNEHGEKQDDVGDEAVDDVKFAAVGVDSATWQITVPICTELRMN